jgi:hypothetical protein
MDKKSTEAQTNPIARPLPSSVSRRTFLAGAAACAAIGPSLLRAATHAHDCQAVLHVATCTSQNGHVHTYALTPGGCALLGSTAVDSFAALAAHPLLPVLYIARDFDQWENLPRGVVETYAVERGLHPLRLLAQTPMALSATGPRSLAVSYCGRHLLVSASTGGAWNAFILNRAGMPASLAIARKETGAALGSNTVSLPTPHGLAFSPHTAVAVGADPGSGRLTLLQPSEEGIAALDRCQTLSRLSPTSPVWTSDGRRVIVANAQSASLSIYEMRTVSGDGSNAGLHPLGTMPTATPVTALLAHSMQPSVFTSRPHGDGSRLEFWKVHGPELRLAINTWVPHHVVALAEHGGALWAATQDRLIRIPMEDLRNSPFEVPPSMQGVRAMVTQNLTAHPFNYV